MCSSSSADYAVVDLSKKKNRKSKEPHSQPSRRVIYDVTQHNIPNTNAKSSVVSSEVADLYSIVNLNKKTSRRSSETNKDRPREETSFMTQSEEKAHLCLMISQRSNKKNRILTLLPKEMEYLF